MSSAVRATRPERGAMEASAVPLALPARLVLTGFFAVGVIVAAPSGFGLLWLVPYAGVGTLLAIRRPSTSIGWILIALGWAFVLVTLPIPATPDQIATGSGGPLIVGLAVASGIAGYAGFLLLGLLAVVFPSGRLPGGRRGAVARVALGVALAFVVAAALGPTISVSLWASTATTSVANPLALLPDLPIWAVITPDTAILPVAAFMAGAAISLVVRFRRSIGVERQQFRWLAAALAFVVAAVVTGWVVAGVVPAAGESGLAWIGAMVAFPCVPIAVGIAVLRYRLYEIDRIVSRTIGWVLVTGLLLGVFTVGVIAIQGALSTVTQGQTLAVAASTLLAAALFQPLRRRVQRAVDHRFDRARYDGERVAAAFGERLRSEVDLGRLRDETLATAMAAVRPARAAVWLCDVPRRPNPNAS